MLQKAIKKKEIESELQKALVQNPRIITIKAALRDDFEITSRVLSELISMGYKGVLLSAFKSATEFMQQIKDRGIHWADNIMVIDAISVSYGVAEKGVTNINGVDFVEGPFSLDDIYKCATEAINNIKSEKKFLFVDSVMAFLLYNEEKRITDFLSKLMNLGEKMDGLSVLITQPESAYVIPVEKIKTLNPSIEFSIAD